MQLIRRFRLLAVVLAMTLVASACGGGGDDTAATTITTAAPSSAGADGGGDSETGDGAADTTTTTGAVQVSGDSGSKWCDQIREAEDGESPIDLDFLNLTSEQLETQFEDALDLFDEWAGFAPREIADDIDVFRDAFRRFVERAKELDFDLEAMADDDEFFNSFNDPTFETAADNIDAYSRDVCGVDFNTTTEPGTGFGADLGDDPVAILLGVMGIPAGLIPEEDIECLRRELGPEFEARIKPGYVPTTEDVAALFTAVDACEIGLG